jgi:hypothetical protein
MTQNRRRGVRRSMRLCGRPRRKSFGLESNNRGGARTYSLAMSKHGAVGRQIEVHPACPIRDDEQMRICHRLAEGECGATCRHDTGDPGAGLGQEYQCPSLQFQASTSAASSSRVTISSGSRAIRYTRTLKAGRKPAYAPRMPNSTIPRCG